MKKNKKNQRKTKRQKESSRSPSSVVVFSDLFHWLGLAISAVLVFMGLVLWSGDIVVAIGGAGLCFIVLAVLVGFLKRYKLQEMSYKKKVREYALLVMLSPIVLLVFIASVHYFNISNVARQEVIDAAVADLEHGADMFRDAERKVEEKVAKPRINGEILFQKFLNAGDAKSQRLTWEELGKFLPNGTKIFSDEYSLKGKYRRYDSNAKKKMGSELELAVANQVKRLRRLHGVSDLEKAYDEFSDQAMVIVTSFELLSLSDTYDAIEDHYYDAYEEVRERNSDFTFAELPHPDLGLHRPFMSLGRLSGLHLLLVLVLMLLFIGLVLAPYLFAARPLPPYEISHRSGRKKPDDGILSSIEN